MTTRAPTSRRLIPAAGRFGAPQRRRRTLWVGLAAATVVAVVAAGTWVMFGSGAIALRTVTVTGTGRVSVQQVVARAALHPGRSLLLVDTSAVAHRVEQLPPVAKADVSRKYPHTLVIRVVERRPAAAVVEGSTVTLVDATGVPFATEGTAPAGLLQLHVTGAVPGAGTPAARAAMHVVAALPHRLRRLVIQVSAGSPDDVRLALRGGRTVTWGSDEANARKAQVLAILLRRPAASYDVSVPDVAVTR